jgi:YHS domain-containing protein
MKSLLIAFLAFTSSFFAQNIDYNVKKGYIAHGYDVVAYFNNEALEGDKAYTTTFDGVKYKFVSQENLETFTKNPEKYVPAYGGYCAYAVALKNEKIGINPESFLVKNDTLYLFYNAWGTNTLKLWQDNDPKALQEKADKNWVNIKTSK